MGRKSSIVKQIEEDIPVRAVKQGDVLMIYQKTGVSGKRVKTDRQFANTRLHNYEFKECAAAGKLLRTQLSPLLFDVKDKLMTGRVLKLMHAIQNTDDVPRGYKSLAKVFENEAAKTLLQGFNFLSGTPLDQLLLKKPLITKDVICFKNFVPASDLLIPEGATHAELQGGRIQLDLVNGNVISEFSKPVRIVLNHRVRQLKLKLIADDSGGALCLYVLKLNFYNKAFRMRGDGARAAAIVMVV